MYKKRAKPCKTVQNRAKNVHLKYLCIKNVHLKYSFLKKTCKNVHHKYFWTQFKNVHLQGQCSLRPCCSRPYCSQFCADVKFDIRFDIKLGDSFHVNNTINFGIKLRSYGIV